jgi:thiol-disulfide isomerase/thioredoxin
VSLFLPQPGEKAALNKMTAKVIYFFSPGCPHCVNAKQRAHSTLDAISKAIPSLSVGVVDVSKTRSEVTSVPTMLFHTADGDGKPLNFRGIETSKLVQMLKDEVASFNQGKSKPKKKKSKTRKPKSRPAKTARPRARKPNFGSLELFWSSIHK